jgi:hypothetical protein
MTTCTPNSSSVSVESYATRTASGRSDTSVSFHGAPETVLDRQGLAVRRPEPPHTVSQPKHNEPESMFSDGHVAGLLTASVCIPRPTPVRKTPAVGAAVCIGVATAVPRCRALLRRSWIPPRRLRPDSPVARPVRTTSPPRIRSLIGASRALVRSRPTARVNGP